jgi:hypothetical protein
MPETAVGLIFSLTGCLMAAAPQERKTGEKKPMSIRMGIAVAAGLFAVVGLAGNAGAEMFAPAPATKPKKVTVTGCAAKGTPDFCIMIKGPKGANYNVTAAVPAVPVDKKVKLQGMTTDKGGPVRRHRARQRQMGRHEGQLPEVGQSGHYGPHAADHELQHAEQA